MKWILQEDGYADKVSGKEIEGGDRNKTLPWWFKFGRVRKVVNLLFVREAVMFGFSEDVAKAGYRLGFAVNGKAYIGDKVLHDREGIMYIGEQVWRFFAVDQSGKEIPEESGKRDGQIGFWVDPKREPWLSRYLDYRPIVD